MFDTPRTGNMFDTPRSGIRAKVVPSGTTQKAIITVYLGQDTLLEIHTELTRDLCLITIPQDTVNTSLMTSLAEMGPLERARAQDDLYARLNEGGDTQ